MLRVQERPPARKCLGGEARKAEDLHKDEVGVGDCGGASCLRRPDPSLPSPQLRALLGGEEGLSVGKGGGAAGFRGWGSASDERERGARRLQEAPALLYFQRRLDRGGGALLRPGCRIRLLLHPLCLTDRRLLSDRTGALCFPPGLRFHVEPVPIASGRATKGPRGAYGSLRGDKGFVMCHYWWEG